ncbi:uncharacterized protein [Pyrus communis]|uniref:uncharacterized protein n=1 Tax=Pyrus communis TaxID=23211 RepID=UPI0035BEBBDF
MKLVSRIKKIQEELSTLEDQCRELLSAKQDLIDKARTTLVGNRNQLHQLQCIGVGKVRFGSAQRYEFRVGFRKIHVGACTLTTLLPGRSSRNPRPIWVFINLQQ